MTKEELLKYKRETPASGLPFEMKDETVEDEHGVYSTGIFEYKGKLILINIENGRWHLSISANHTLGYFELKQIRYMFLPNDMQVAQIFPPREQFVNLHENCFHLWQL